MEQIINYIENNYLFILEIASSIIATFFGIALINSEEQVDKNRRRKKIGLIIGLIFTVVFKSLQNNKENTENIQAIHYRDSIEKERQIEYGKNISYLQNLQHADSMSLDTVVHIKDSLGKISQKQLDLYKLTGLAIFPVKDLYFEMKYTVCLHDLDTDSSVWLVLSKKIDEMHEGDNKNLFIGNFSSDHYATMTINGYSESILNRYKIPCPYFIKLYFHTDPNNNIDQCVGQADIYSKTETKGNSSTIQFNFEKDSIIYDIITQGTEIIPYNPLRKISSLKQLDNRYLIFGGIVYDQYSGIDNKIYKIINGLNVRFNNLNSSYVLSTTDNTAFDSQHVKYYKLSFK